MFLIGCKNEWRCKTVQPTRAVLCFGPWVKGLHMAGLKQLWDLLAELQGRLVFGFDRITF